LALHFELEESARCVIQSFLLNSDKVDNQFTRHFSGKTVAEKFVILKIAECPGRDIDNEEIKKGIQPPKLKTATTKRGAGVKEGQ
jgi:hypothetical protein